MRYIFIFIFAICIINFILILALKTLANSEFHYKKAEEMPMPEKIDLFGFIKLCDDALGIKPS